MTCKTCAGQGILFTSGDYWNPASWEPCPDCAQLDKCPNCLLQFLGEAADIFAEGVDCPMCGFNYLKGK